jgi:hypothetical protein
MRPATQPRRWRRSPVGATSSARLLRWPARNYFAEMEPRLKESHPVDDLMAKDPGLRRIRRRAHRHLSRLQAQTDSSAVLDFEAERNHLDAARVETAYNIGFEGGLAAGMIAGLGRARGGRRDPDEVTLLRAVRAAIAGTSASRDRVQATLLEIAWALAVEPPAAPPTGRPARRKRGRLGR